MKIYKHFVFAVVLALSLMGASLASAQVTEPLPDPETVIQTEQNSVPDGKIEARIANIFTEIDGLDGVSARVNEGVVTLGGQAANEAHAQQAMRLALRLEGVVTVVDEIERTLDVKDNIAPMLLKAKTDMANLIKALPLIGFALTAFVLTGVFGAFISRRNGLWNKLAPNPFLSEIMAQAVKVMFWLIGLAVAMRIVGAGALLTGMLGGAGVAGIAIGFAVRDSLENYISSIMLSLRQPFRAKDHVIINEHEGIVVRLTSRATILMTLEGNHLRIPNSVVFKGIILNYTTNPERRFDFEIGVDADDNPIAAMQVGLDAMKSHDFVLADPKPSAYIMAIGDSNIVIKYTGWICQSKTDFSKARSISITSVMDVLSDKGFTMPEPIYRLRFDTPGSLSALGIDSKSKAEIKSSVVKRAPDEPAPIETEISAESLDVSPETHLSDMINEELAQDENNDLLDKKRPTE